MTTTERILDFAHRNSSHGKREKGDKRREYHKGVPKKKEKAKMPKVRRVVK